MMELDIQRRMTREFIASAPTEIVLIPTVSTVLPSGGKSSVDGTPRAAQNFKLIPMTFDQRPTITVDGVDRVISYTLLGEYDAAMAVWDHWTGDDGSVYTIVAFAPGHEYEKKALVERRLPEG